MPEKRWKLRFNSFQKSMRSLENAINQKKYSELERAGLIKTFESSFELGWKTLKDLLEQEGYEPKTPRQTIKQAFQSGFIQDGTAWLQALDSRNLMSHTYDEDDSKTACKLIKNQFFHLLKELNKTLAKDVTKCSD